MVSLMCTSYMYIGVYTLQSFTQCHYCSSEEHFTSGSDKDEEPSASFHGTKLL